MHLRHAPARVIARALTKMEFQLIFGNVRNRTAPGCCKRRTRGATPLSPPKRSIERSFGMMRLASLIALLLATSPVAAQTPGTSTSPTCTQDAAYCSDIGASTSTTTGSGASSSASSGGSGGSNSGGGSSSGGAGAGAPLSIPNAACGDGFPVDAWGGCN
jgi:uncharacterized membrane protein YgcG